jgi:hypothetical protein
VAVGLSAEPEPQAASSKRKIRGLIREILDIIVLYEANPLL